MHTSESVRAIFHVLIRSSKVHKIILTLYDACDGLFESPWHADDGFDQRFYMVPLDADCSNSNVKHIFEIDGWKDWDFSQQNLVKLSGGNLFCFEKEKMREPKQTYLLSECLSACHLIIHKGEKLNLLALFSLFQTSLIFIYSATNKFWLGWVDKKLTSFLKAGTFLLQFLTKEVRLYG